MHSPVGVSDSLAPLAASTLAVDLEDELCTFVWQEMSVRLYVVTHKVTHIKTCLYRFTHTHTHTTIATQKTHKNEKELLLLSGGWAFSGVTSRPGRSVTGTFATLPRGGAPPVRMFSVRGVSVQRVGGWRIRVSVCLYINMCIKWCVRVASSRW